MTVTRSRKISSLLNASNKVGADYLDVFDSDQVTGLVDSAYIQLRDRFQDDSTFVTDIIDSGYISARAGGVDSASTLSLIDSAYAFGLTKIASEEKFWIQESQPVISAVDEYWFKPSENKLYKSAPSTTLTTTMPAVTVDGTNSPYGGFRDYPSMYPSSATRTNISGTDALGGTFTLGTTASAWFYFEGGPYPANPQNLNKGFYYNFDDPQDLRGIIIENSDPNAGRLERIDYEDGSYADNGFPGGGTVTFYNSGGSTMGKTASANTTGNTFVDISHPNGQLATRIGFSQVGDYYAGNDVFLFFAGGRVWNEVGVIRADSDIQVLIDSNLSNVNTDFVPLLDSTYDLGSSTKKWKDLYLSGNTINLGGARISAVAGGGISITDSAGAPTAVSGSNVATNVIDSGVVNTLTQSLIDSSYVQLRQSGGAITVQDEGSSLATSATTLNFTGSGVTASGTGATKTITISGGGGGGGVDSAATITLINSVIDSVGPSRAFTYTYTATSNQTTFSGADDNGNTLAYSSGNIITFLNGILLVDSEDYVSTSGNSIVLNSAANLNDILNVIKFRASGSGGNLSHEQYKYTTSSPTTTFSGNDDNGISLSYEVGELQVFLNGILLIDSQDYTASNGTSVVLTAATDSNDVLAVSRYIGGNSSVTNVVISRQDVYVYTTASPATTITGSDDNSATLSYIENQVQVFQNGILLIDSADYTATNGTSIVLGVATDSGDTIVVQSLRGGNTSLDSADVLAIAGGGGGGTDSATVIALSGELKGGMFRINPQSLSINTTIDSAENAHVAGPISFDSGVVLTINGNLVIS
jgi:hypothetical protein